MAKSRILVSSESLQELENGSILLDGNHKRHIISALRLKEGDAIIATDGNGVSIECIIGREKGRVYKLTGNAKVQKVQSKPDRAILALAIGSQSAFCDAIQKATELGVDVIIPILCKFSKSSGGNFSKCKVNHWQKVISSAFIQSNRSYLPNLLEPITLKALLSNHNRSGMFALHPYAKKTVDINFLVHHQGRKMTAVVGPEAGFSDSELSMFQKSGIECLRLTKTILRYETAASSIIAILSLSS